MELYRPDAQTVVARALATPERMFRPREHPLNAGAGIDLARTRIEVVAVEAGMPTEAVVRFDADIDTAHFRWLRWDQGNDGEGRWVTLTPPAIGTRVRVD